MLFNLEHARLVCLISPKNQKSLILCNFGKSTIHRRFSFRKSGKNVISLVYADFGKVRIPFCPLL